LEKIEEISCSVDATPPPPSGTYVVVSDNPNYHGWLNQVLLGNSCFCPGKSAASCCISGYSNRLEQLRVALLILQEARDQKGMYFINTMHILLKTETPKHLLIVGPFNGSYSARGIYQDTDDCIRI
jgi:hypothetical protein